MEGSRNELLCGKSNYEKWSSQMRTELQEKGLWSVVDPDQPVHETFEEETAWKSKNARARHAILISCEAKPFSVIENMNSARQAWSFLEAEYGSSEDEISQIEEIPEFEMNEYGNSDFDLNSPQTASSEPENETKSIERYNSDIQEYITLFEAVYNGDWCKTKEFLDCHPDTIRATIPYSGKNALHIAITEGHLKIVENLVELMTDEDMDMSRVDNFSPLMAAIEIGNLPIAQCLIIRHRKLISIIHSDGLPLRYAIVTCRRKMVPYLYSVTPIKDLKSIDNGYHCAALVSQSIYAKHYDIALSLLDRFPDLVITPDAPRKSPLYALATSVVFNNSRSSLTFWRRWIYDCIRISSWAIGHISVEIQNLEDNQSEVEDTNVDKVLDSFYVARKQCSGLLRKLVLIPLQLLDIKSIYQLKLAHEQIREILRRTCKVIKETSDRKKLEDVGIIDTMIHAAYYGNVEFITGIAKANPELIWGPYVSRKVIETGIQQRHPQIFSLIYGLRNKVGLASYNDDDNKSNMLHKAAIIAPTTQLNGIPGAALQMQRELQWFKEVKEIVSPSASLSYTTAHPFTTPKRKDFLTAQAIFTKSHKELVIEGEKWMKDTSSSCTVVGALIITVTFASAFTFPGGNEQTHGYPMFSDKRLFRVFTISNAVALSASTTSVLMFLGILTSRYAEEDFLTSLPKKLIIGLSTLFLSIAAMLAAFCVGVSLMFHQKMWIVLPSALLASIPVALFAVLQFPLLIDIFMSTYGPSIFKKNTKRWI